MITTKQRAYLRSLANKTDAIMQIGKNGIEESFINQLDAALEKREIVKINVLENSMLDPKEAQMKLMDALKAEGVQVIGNKIVLYRQSSNKDNRKIQLP